MGHQEDMSNLVWSLGHRQGPRTGTAGSGCGCLTLWELWFWLSTGAGSWGKGGWSDFFSLARCWSGLASEIPTGRDCPFSLQLSCVWQDWIRWIKNGCSPAAHRSRACSCWCLEKAKAEGPYLAGHPWDKGASVSWCREERGTFLGELIQQRRAPRARAN